MISRRWCPYLISLAAGGLYALADRFIGRTGACFVAVILGMPVVLGAVSAHFTPPEASGWWRQLWAPLLNALLFVAAALAFASEVLGTLLIYLPVTGILFLALGHLGANLYVKGNHLYNKLTGRGSCGLGEAQNPGPDTDGAQAAA